MIMRTIVDLPVFLVRRAKTAAALEKKSLRAFLTEAVVHALERSAKKRIACKGVPLPRVSTLRPDTLRLGSDDMAHMIKQKDGPALAGHLGR